MSSPLLAQIWICHIHAIQGIVATIQPIWPTHRLWFRLVWDFKKQHHQHHVPQRRHVLSLTLPMITTPSTPTIYLYGMAAQPGTSVVNHKKWKAKWQNILPGVICTYYERDSYLWTMDNLQYPGNHCICIKTKNVEKLSAEGFISGESGCFSR